MSAIVDVVKAEISERAAWLQAAREIVARAEADLEKLLQIETLALDLEGGADGTDAMPVLSIPPSPVPELPPAPTSAPPPKPTPEPKRIAATNGHRPASTAKQPQVATKENAVALMLRLIAERQPISPRELAEEMGIPKARVKAYADELIERGLIQRFGKTKAVVYRTTAQADAECAAKFGTKGRVGGETGWRRKQQREEIQRLVAEDEGALNEQRLAQATGIDREDVAFICGELLEQNLLVMGPDGTYTTGRGGVQPTVTPRPDPKIAEAATLAVVARFPRDGITVVEIANEVGEISDTVSKRLRRLAERGKVRVERAGRIGQSVRYFPVEQEAQHAA